MKAKKQLLCMVEGAVMIALAWALDFVCSFIPSPFVYGGSITIGMLPIVYYSYRRGWIWGTGAGLVFACIQMIMGWHTPPANTLIAIVLCVLLDYVVAFAVIGIADLIARPFGKHRLVGYGVGGVAVCLLRFVCSFLSGGLLWGSYAPEGMNMWVYSLLYNGGYMVPNAILTGVLAVLLCKVFDPKTLKPMKK